MTEVTRMLNQSDRERYRDLGMRTQKSIFKKWYKAGILKDVDKGLAEEVKRYWKDKTDKEIDPTLHTAYMNITGKKDPRLITTGLYHYEVMPVLNDYSMTEYYGDKNIYDLILGSSNSAVTVLRNIRGKYFDKDYNNIELEKAKKILLHNVDKGLIIKPSKSNNGLGIKKLNIVEGEIYVGQKRVTISQLLKEYKGNFIVQEMLEQHPNMAAPHPESVNTIRMVTFRWKNEIRYLMAFARFGSNGDIRDNATVDISPRVGVKDNGEFFEYGVSQDLEKFTHHPTTGFDMSRLKHIPNYEEFKQFVIDRHKNLLHVDVVSWDIAVGVDGKPVFIEANFKGSISFYQLVTQKPFFGDLTEEVMEYVQKEYNSKKPVLEKSYSRRSNRIQEAKLKKEREQNEKIIADLKAELNSKAHLDNITERAAKLEKELETLRKENEKYKKEYNKMKQSSSWKVTAPIRKISSLVKRK